MRKREKQLICFTGEGAAGDLKGELQQVHGDGQDAGEWHLLSVAIISIDDTHLILTNLQDHRTVPVTVSFKEEKKKKEGRKKNSTTI